VGFTWAPAFAGEMEDAAAIQRRKTAPYPPTRLMANPAA
jgi:hypothetical protein